MARETFSEFAGYINPNYRMQWFHKYIMDELQKFYESEENKLVISMPPQFGKSEIVSRMLPAWLLGKNPNYKIALCSYSFDLAKSFNTDIKRIMTSPLYQSAYSTRIVNKTDKDIGQNTAYQFDVKDGGYFLSVGVGGSLTGKTVDVGIIDDPYKSMSEAKSPNIRGKVWDWYNSVFSTRGHNNSKQIIMMTRWEQNDIAGRLINDGVREIKFQAIKDGYVKDDPREDGEALWAEKHGLERLLEIKKRDPATFDAMYQQDPKPNKQVLVFDWKETDKLPDYGDIIIGIDWGFTHDPTAMVEIRYHTGQRKAVVRELLYKTANQSPDILKEIENIYRKEYGDDEPLIVADKGNYEGVRRLKTLGLRVVEAKKPPNSRISGIEKLNSWNIEYYQSPNIKRELKAYQYIVIDGAVTNTPLDGNDHTFDATKYGFERIR